MLWMFSHFQWHGYKVPNVTTMTSCDYTNSCHVSPEPLQKPSPSPIIKVQYFHKYLTFGRSSTCSGMWIGSVNWSSIFSSRSYMALKCFSIKVRLVWVLFVIYNCWVYWVPHRSQARQSAILLGVHTINIPIWEMKLIHLWNIQVVLWNQLV
jgi:hypothetical protein